MKRVLFLLVAMLAGSTLAARIVTGNFVIESGEIRQCLSVHESAAPAGTDRELLKNPGFETGSLPPWTTNNWVVDTVYPRSGDYCASDVGNYWIQQYIDTTPANEITSITFWARQPDQPAAQACWFYYSDGTYESHIHFPTPDWVQYDLTGNLNQGKSLVAVRIWGYSGGGPGPDSTYLDDVSIQVPGSRKDVGVVELVHPRDTVEFDSLHTPIARVANFGDNAETFPVIMRIEDICDSDPYYYDTCEVTLSPGDTTVVPFDTWRPRYPALHRARCWTELPGDTNPANNMLEHFFYVQRMTGIEEHPGQAVARRRLTVVPTVGRCFQLSCNRSQRISDRLVVCDASGAIVWQSEMPGPEAVSLKWTGTDLNGRKLAPGVYLAKSGNATARMVLVE